MPFLECTRMQLGGEWNVTGSFQLAGYGLLHQVWTQRNRPGNQGWHVSAGELVSLHSGGQHTTDSMRLVFQLSENPDVGHAELLDVYAYTYMEGGMATWTPLMLRLRYVDVEALPDNAPPATETDDDFVEFLYLRGEDARFNFGRVGMVNAVFIEGQARNYFRKFF